MNRIVEWSDGLNLGIPEIDTQHRGLVDSINQLWGAIVKKAGSSEVVAILDELERYVVSHFTTEEALMRVQRYPAFEEHRDEHRHFQAQIAQAKAGLVAGNFPGLELLHYLTDWLVKHIQHGDKAYADFFEARKRPRSLISRLFGSLAGSRA